MKQLCQVKNYDLLWKIITLVSFVDFFVLFVVVVVGFFWGGLGFFVVVVGLFVFSFVLSSLRCQETISGKVTVSEKLQK